MRRKASQKNSLDEKMMRPTWGRGESLVVGSRTRPTGGESTHSFYGGLWVHRKEDREDRYQLVGAISRNGKRQTALNQLPYDCLSMLRSRTVN